MHTLSGKQTSSKLVLMFLLCLVVALLVGVQPTRADNVTVFQMSGTFPDNSMVSGTLTIDLTDGMITASNLSYLGQTYSDILTQGAFFGETEPGQTPIPVGYDFAVGIFSFTPQLFFILPGTSTVDSLIGYGGGSLCSFNASCGPDQEGDFFVSSFDAVDGSFTGLQSGQLVATPEPTTVILLFLGLGLLLLTRSRQANASDDLSR
ncbi:MAG TPA: PEP-CTERM sorting domain-containing protein [Candidatus Acidoferrum sp.]|nr:PEP-CTERM sorting domain-containing protein [Candidatus Acidoferrum sp.]